MPFKSWKRFSRRQQANQAAAEPQPGPSSLAKDDHAERSTDLPSMSGDGEGTLASANRAADQRRRSNSLLKYADDTDTETDLLVFTEDALQDILEDPAHGNNKVMSRHHSLLQSAYQPLTEHLWPSLMPSAHHHTRRLSLLPSLQHRQLLQGVHGMSVGGAGVRAYPSRPEDHASRKRILVTLRRRKSVHKSVRTIDYDPPMALLDYQYHSVTDRFLMNCGNWHFNSFTFDTMTGGHSLSQLLFYLFKQYNFIGHFNLDIVAVWKCFRLFETGYHDTNPYHNSFHASDVTQAMHCFIQEERIGPHLTPLERLCAVLAAGGHDLDHPGVGQQFLVATKSHLAALYNNLSVLESHHWRFAMSCLKESGIFAHFEARLWKKMEHLIRSLILATDMAQHADYLTRFRAVLASKEQHQLNTDENKLFVLQMALKCADLANPCRTWKVSKRWSEQICSEFYRQGDFERQLELPITPICNRYKTSMATIQTGFFKNVVQPLFELWDQYMGSPLSYQLLTNLRINHSQWENILNPKLVTRRESIAYAILSPDITTRLGPLPPPIASPLLRRRSSSLNDQRAAAAQSLPSVNELRLWSEVTASIILRLYPLSSQQQIGSANVERGSSCCDGNGCGTPPSPSPARLLSAKNSLSSDSGSDKPIYLTPRGIPIVSCDIEPPLSPGCDENDPPSYLAPSFGRPHAYNSSSSHPLSPLTPPMSENKVAYNLGRRRGSAPGCIDTTYSSCELAAAALVFLQSTLNKGQTRRSSAPVD